jgi:hypothetical protein
MTPGSQTRQDNLFISHQLFLKNGCQATSMQIIVEQTGIALSSYVPTGKLVSWQLPEELQMDALPYFPDIFLYSIL